jgi:hypothetical protein
MCAEILLTADKADSFHLYRPELVANMSSEAQSRIMECVIMDSLLRCSKDIMN